jgi:hypothetical protein
VKSKLSREKILKMIRKNIRDQEDLAATLRHCIHNVSSDGESLDDIVQYSARLEETLVATLTLEDLLDQIRLKEKKADD